MALGRLGIGLSSCFLRMDSAVFPGRNLSPAGICDPPAFVRIMRRGSTRICRRGFTVPPVIPC